MITDTQPVHRVWERLRADAAHWFPTLDADLLDRIVAAAWLEACDEIGAWDDRLPVAAAIVRRHGLGALSGESPVIAGDAEARALARAAGEPEEPPPPARRLPSRRLPQHRRVRARRRATRVAAAGAFVLVGVALVAIVIGSDGREAGTRLASSGDANARTARVADAGRRSTPLRRTTFDARPERVDGSRHARAGERARRSKPRARRNERTRARERRASRRRTARKRSAPAVVRAQATTPPAAATPQPAAPTPAPRPAPVAPAPAPRSAPAPAAPAPKPPPKRTAPRRPAPDFDLDVGG